MDIIWWCNRVYQSAGYLSCHSWWGLLLKTRNVPKLWVLAIGVPGWHDARWWSRVGGNNTRDGLFLETIISPYCQLLVCLAADGVSFRSCQPSIAGRHSRSPYASLHSALPKDSITAKFYQRTLQLGSQEWNFRDGGSIRCTHSLVVITGE